MYNLSDVERFVRQRRPEGLIIDTNLLLLFLVGKCNPAFIAECKVTQQFSLDDFELLEKIIAYFKKVVITPHILAELSNQSQKAFYGNRLHSYFRVIVEFLKSAEERHLELKSLLNIDVEVICDFGFTDIAMFELAKQTYMPILTDDLKFYAYSIGNQVPAIKFEHIRSATISLS